MAGHADRILITREVELARQDLRETMAEVAQKVERAEDRLSPKRAIGRHPLLAACTAGTLGFIAGGGNEGLSSMMILGALISWLVPLKDGN